MEQVVLLDAAGQATGAADKATVHHSETPLHLAFSCYVFNERGEFLLTQRAHSKPTWPSVWTNSCCGHPAPGEAVRDAIRRRLSDELGIEVGNIELALPLFRYRAVMDNGIVENEMCPVFRAFTEDSPLPVDSEVANTQWVEWAGFTREVLSGQSRVSPWCREQVEALVTLGTEPSKWAIGSDEELPAAAR